MAVLAVTLIAWILPAVAVAQSVWVEPVRTTGFRAEFHRPVFDYGDLSTFSGIWTFGTTIDAGPGRWIHLEVPYARFESDDWQWSTSTLGNLYVGLIDRNPGSDLRLLFGGRLPTTSDDEPAALYAMMSDEIDGLDAFIPHVASITVALEYRPERQQGFGMRARLAPILWIDTADESEEVLQDGIEIWFHYHAQAVFASRDVTVGAGMSGRYLFTEDGDSFGDRNEVEAGIFVNWNLGRWTPTARLQIPVEDDLQEYLDPSLFVGVGLGALPR